MNPLARTKVGPLAGTMVLDLSTVGPASRATRILSDYGADVVKVGPVAGRGPQPINPPFYAYSGARNYRRCAIDLRDDNGRDAFLALARTTDVIVESFRPGVVDRLGIGYAAVRMLNPRIVYASTSGYGQTGARASWAGHDIDYLAAGGFLATSQPGEGGAPPIPGATVADAAGGGMHAALAIMAALLGRIASGEGAYLDVSATGGVLWLMSLALDEHLAAGTDPAPGHDMLTGRYACYGVYPTADDEWLAVGAIEPKFFANLCAALDCGKWTAHQLDDAVQEEIRADFTAAFRTKGRDAWVVELAGADTCVAPVLSVSEVAAHARADGALVEAKHPEAGSFEQMGPLLAGMEPLAEPVELPDPEATDTAELLAGAGIDASRIADLRERGVVR